jgi:hypothetical protein
MIRGSFTLTLYLLGYYHFSQFTFQRLFVEKPVSRWFIKANNGKLYTQLYDVEGGAIYGNSIHLNDKLTLIYKTTDGNIMEQNFGPLCSTQMVKCMQALVFHLLPSLN